MASRQLLRLQDGADSTDENIAIAKEHEIKNLAKDVSKALKALGDGLNATGRKKEKIDRQEESDSDKSSSWLYHCMDVADQVIMLYEKDANNLILGLKKREKLLRGVLGITNLTSQYYLFEYLEWACMLLDYPENRFVDELNRVKKCYEEVKEKKEEISRLVDEANGILSEMIESEEINKVKERQFDNVVRLAHLKINSCRSRLAGAEEIIVKIDATLSTKMWVSRFIRGTGWVVSSYCYYQTFSSITPFPIFVAGSILTGIAWLSFFPQNTYAIYKMLSNAAFNHRELMRELNDLRASIESLTDQKGRY